MCIFGTYNQSDPNGITRSINRAAADCERSELFAAAAIGYLPGGDRRKMKS
jgi:hypothetical protein